MTITQFIEKAIEGGWWADVIRHYRTQIVNKDEPIKVHVMEHGGLIYATFAASQMPIEVIFLDPEAWKAVGKVEGWSEVGMTNRSPMGSHLPAGEWLFRWHLMIDALAEGGTIESYLESL